MSEYKFSSSFSSIPIKSSNIGISTYNNSKNFFKSINIILLASKRYCENIAKLQKK